MGLPASRRAMQRLVDAYYQTLYRYAYRLSGSTSEAEDLTQDAFCKAQMKLSQLQDESRVKAWLFSILRNAYLHRLRDRKQEKTVSWEGIEEIAESSSEALSDIEPEQLQRALNDMPEPFRTPIVLYYFADFSYRDIAEQMELPLGTVMSRLSRAKAFLRSRLLHPALAAAPRRAGNGM